jgi:hypothetical protein
VLPLVAILSAVLLGFAALTIDIGHMYVVRNQLQNAADAAALAGASVYIEDIGLSGDQLGMIQVGLQRAQAYSEQNETLLAGTLLSAGDVSFGRHDFDNREGALLSSGRWNAVEVTVRRTANSQNGPVQLFFAHIFGKSDTDLIASARAVADDRAIGYKIQDPTGMLPFTIHEDIYDDYLNNGPDDYSYEDGEVKKWADDIREIRLYPWKESGWDGMVLMEGGGNFGTLNIGVGDQGTAEVEDQILNGITAEHMEAEFGTSALMFFDDYGEEQTYEATGNPGVSVGMRDSVEARIGDVVGFFLHNDIVDNGSNAIYTICAIRFGRIMHIKLTGKPDERSLTVQPTPYTSGCVLIDQSVPSTGGMLSRPVIVQ